MKTQISQTDTLTINTQKIDNLMKTIALFTLALISILFVSCSEEGDTIVNVPPNNPNTTSVTLDIKKPDAINLTGKSVLRGTIVPAYVETINVLSRNIASNNTQNTIFDMVDSGTSETAFKLDNIELGNTEFSATTTTNTIGKLTATTSPIATDTFGEQKASNPYTLFTSPLQTKNITTLDNTVSLPMTTQNGRIIALFKMQSDMPNGYYATIEVKQGATTLPIITINNTTNGNVYFSNENAIVGAKISYTIKTYNASSQLQNTALLTKTVVANTDLNTTYTLTKGDINIFEASNSFSFEIKASQDTNVDGIKDKDERVVTLAPFNVYKADPQSGSLNGVTVTLEPNKKYLITMTNCPPTEKIVLNGVVWRMTDTPSIMLDNAIEQRGVTKFQYTGATGYYTVTEQL